MRSALRKRTIQVSDKAASRIRIADRARFSNKEHTPVGFRFIFLSFGSIFFGDPRAPSIQVAILRKGHIVHVRGMIFICLADLRAYARCVVGYRRRSVRKSGIREERSLLPVTPLALLAAIFLKQVIFVSIGFLCYSLFVGIAYIIWRVDE